MTKPRFIGCHMYFSDMFISVTRHQIPVVKMANLNLNTNTILKNTCKIEPAYTA